MPIYDFFAGAIAMGFLACGMFFFRFWSRTRDSLFLSFGIAFWLLAVGQAVLTLTGIPVEERSWLYLMRLAAFLLIIVAIMRKNLSRRPG